MYISLRIFHLYYVNEKLNPAFCKKMQGDEDYDSGEQVDRIEESRRRRNQAFTGSSSRANQENDAPIVMNIQVRLMHNIMDAYE